VYTFPAIYDGIEIDMLSLGDADCIIVTRWFNSQPHRVLIDGGSGGSYEDVAEFLISHGYDLFWAVVCSHCHADHASGLVKLVKDPRFTFLNAWMHDLRNHIGADALQRASRADDGVGQVVETTAALMRAFASRLITIRAPFAGARIAWSPDLTVLGPTLDFYKRTIEEFTDIQNSMSVSSGLAQFANNPSFYGTSPMLSAFAKVPISSDLYISPPAPGSLASLFAGIITSSTLEEKPKTQPFNNTSTILGVRHNGLKFMLTADAGSDALDQIGDEWNSLDWMQVPHHGSDGNLSPDNIERFCPRVAYVSAKGDSCHPSRAVINGLIKVRSNVYSTHTGGHLWLSSGNVPARSGYWPVEPLKATGGMKLQPLATVPL
jgi:beta-lactamase superfamily II metal-dependent hydrolase